MAKIDDICRSIADEAANLNVETLKNCEDTPKNKCYSKPNHKYQLKKRSIY